MVTAAASIANVCASTPISALLWCKACEAITRDVAALPNVGDIMDEWCHSLSFRRAVLEVVSREECCTADVLIVWGTLVYRLMAAARSASEIEALWFSESLDVRTCVARLLPAADSPLPLEHLLRVITCGGVGPKKMSDRGSRKVVADCVPAATTGPSAQLCCSFFCSVLEQDVTEYQLELGTEAFRDSVVIPLASSAATSPDAIVQWCVLVCNLTVRCPVNVSLFASAAMCEALHTVGVHARDYSSVRWVSAAVCNLTTRDYDSQVWIGQPSTYDVVIAMGRTLEHLWTARDKNAAGDTMTWYLRLLNHLSFHPVNQKLLGTEDIKRIVRFLCGVVSTDNEVQWLCTAITNLTGSLPANQLLYAGDKTFRQALVKAHEAAMSEETITRWCAAVVTLASRLLGSSYFASPAVAAVVETLSTRIHSDEAGEWLCILAYTVVHSCTVIDDAARSAFLVALKRAEAAIASSTATEWHSRAVLCVKGAKSLSDPSKDDDEVLSILPSNDAAGIAASFTQPGVKSSGFQERSQRYSALWADSRGASR